jgi:hypothetical protein
MGVNYAKIITWPTYDELRERQRMIQIRKNEARAMWFLPLAPVGSETTGKANATRSVSLKATRDPLYKEQAAARRRAVCQAYHDAAAQRPDDLPAVKRAIAFEHGIHIETLYEWLRDEARGIA